MGKWLYRKQEPSHIQGVCVVCELRPQQKKKDKYMPYCNPCKKDLYGHGQSRWKPRHEKASDKRNRACDLCGFVPVHMCQLDLDHIDGNHSNNSPDNLQTLCANCHRLKTWLNKDWQ